MKVLGANVLLTGASRGIGEVVARELVEKGARVAITARSADELNKVAEDLERRGGKAVAIPGDVTKKADRARMVREAEKAFGPLDVLINNAGFDEWSPYTELETSAIERMIELNLTSTILFSREVLPGMLERKRGHILNMASTAGKLMVPFTVTYSATKHGVVGFTLSLRAETVGTGVSASVVCPGYVQGAGMYERDWGSKTPPGTKTTVETVAKKTVAAIEKDQPEVVVSGFNGRVGDVLLAISPRLMTRIGWSGPYKMLKAEGERRERLRAAGERDIPN
ncbi:MAG: SDR family NAD(P)-dependent oxidoreductase [Actinobacteria bacterium]|nr:SDR family NAD(P)-dependent oxidoreductase [Actinomycetota bacterium]